MSDRQFLTFKDLDVWKAARDLRRRIYAIVRLLPDHERYNAASQMRRAALSVTNNIAEGHGRYHFQETIQFLRQSRGSLEELLDDLTLCEDESYIAVAEIRATENEISRVRALLNGYVRYLKQKKESTASTVREDAAVYNPADNEDEW